MASAPPATEKRGGARVISLVKHQEALDRIAELENKLASSPEAEPIAVRLQTAITQLTSQRDEAWTEIDGLKAKIETLSTQATNSAQGVAAAPSDLPELQPFPGSKVVFFAEKVTEGELFYMERTLCSQVNGWEPTTQASWVESSAWRFNGKDSMNRIGVHYVDGPSGRPEMRMSKIPVFSKNAYIEAIFRIVNPDVGE